MWKRWEVVFGTIIFSEGQTVTLCQPGRTLGKAMLNTIYKSTNGRGESVVMLWGYTFVCVSGCTLKCVPFSGAYLCPVMKVHWQQAGWCAEMTLEKKEKKQARQLIIYQWCSRKEKNSRCCCRAELIQSDRGWWWIVKVNKGVKLLFTNQQTFEIQRNDLFLVFSYKKTLGFRCFQEAQSGLKALCDSLQTALRRSRAESEQTGRNLLSDKSVLFRNKKMLMLLELTVCSDSVLLTFEIMEG